MKKKPSRPPSSNDHHLDASCLSKDLAWFSHVLETRMKLYLGHESKHSDIQEIAPPPPSGKSPYELFLQQHPLNFSERLVLVLSMVPQLQPQLLDQFFIKNATYDRDFTEFGGGSEALHKGFLPTGETALFLLAGDDIQKRIDHYYLFSQDHLFSEKSIIALERSHEKAPYLSGLLSISDQYIDLFTHFQRQKDQYSINFPAQPISTNLDWDDLVLSATTRAEITEILTWMKHGDTLLYEWDMHAKIKPGYRAIFYGPPGTGKTLTATLMGKATNKEVYRIDLSKVVSKYIGETEKNLARVFDRAENKQWILFFDEADALFGKRTQLNNAHDRYANQEVSYLLQRIEDFPGIVILASNMKSNLDEAFTRRFQSIIHFPMPKPEERLMLWEKGFSSHCELEKAIDLHHIAQKYELAGGSMMNVIRYSSLAALKRNSREILLTDLEAGIKKEFRKEGRTTG